MFQSEREKQYILNRGASMVADYFRNKIIDHYSRGMVAILVKTFIDGLYFMPCDERGYPNMAQFRTVEFRSLAAFIVDDGSIPNEPITVEEYTVMVEKPLVMANIPDFDEWTRRPQVFLWEGRVVDRQKVQLETMDVKKLILLAQEAIKRREGLIIDVAIDNKMVE
jgi:hypothetical protein